MGNWLRFQKYDKDERKTKAGEILLAWHEQLEKGDRGSRATLRRAKNLESVAFVPAYHRLLWDLRGADYGVSPQRLVAVAGLAAWVGENVSGPSFAKQMGTPEKGSARAPISEARFRRILEEPEAEARFVLLARAVRALRGNVNLLSLADSVYFWKPEVRRDWAYEYYEVAPAK